jgi:hypothetical protein
MDLFDDYKIDQSTLSAKKQLASANPLLKDLLFNGKCRVSYFLILGVVLPVF